MSIDFVTFLTQALAWVSNMLAVFAALGGVAALVSIVVDIAKRLGLPDGSAPNLAFGLNALLFIVLALLGLFTKVSPAQFNDFAAALATLLTLLLGFVGQVILTPKIHAALKQYNVPLLVKSHSSGSK